MAVDLSNCETEPIRYPGAVQPHGVLLVLNGMTGRVEGASESILPLHAVGAAEVIGQPFEALFGSVTFQELLDCAQGRAGSLVRLDYRGQKLTATPHLNTTGQLLLDIEVAGDISDLQRMVYQCRQGLSKLRSLVDLSDLFEESVALLREITGYDRVMLRRASR